MCKRNTRFDMVPWVPIVIGVVGLFLGEVEGVSQARQTSFSCASRNPGYYADVTTGCQVYHMCDNVGRQFSYSCPNATLFQQRMLICDHWYMVNCSTAISHYDANLRIGQKDRHFVDDSEVNVVTRTPRPDLLTAPSTTLEYNTIYRHGESNLSPTKYVGVESNDENSTDEATYNPPSHWSTEISKQATSSVENNENRRMDYQNAQGNGQKQRTNYQNQRVNHQNPTNNYYQNIPSNQNQETYQNPQTTNQRVNYRNSQSNYQNQRANGQNQRVNDQNPSENDQNVETNQNQETYQNTQINNRIQNLFQNSQSNYQNQRANNQNQESPQSSDTRPVQPEYNLSRRYNTRNSSVRGKAIDVSSRNSGNNEIVNYVNFKSTFKATTPVYPSLVKDTTRTPNNIGLQPPLFSSQKTAISYQPELSQEIQPPKNPQQGQDQILNEEGLINEQRLFSNFMMSTLPPYSTPPPYPSEDEYNEFVKNLHEPIKGLLEINSYESGQKKTVINFESNFKATTPQYPTSVDPTSPEPSDIGVLPPKQRDNKVNFESTYKATTPNYPTFVEQTSQNPSEAGILPPKENNSDNNIDSLVVFKSNFKATTPQYPTHVDATSPNPLDVGLLAPKAKVVYKSNFKATTPNYPTFVEATSPNPSDVGLVAPKDTVVNFHSSFKATTPNYPTSVASTSPDPGQAGLLAPQPSNEVLGLKSDKYVTDASSFSDNYNQFPFKTFDPTSEYIEESDLQEIPGIRLSNFMKSFDYKQWQTLRQAFKIPEYDFPLDDATRPSYNSVVNSFEPISNRK